MTIKFLKDHVAERGADTERTYKSGQVVDDLNSASENHFTSRGLAVEVAAGTKVTKKVAKKTASKKA